MKNRLLPLAVVVALGLAAPLGSLALFYWWQPVAPSLAGALPTPPPPVEEALEADIDPAEWRGKWTLLVVAPTADSCGDACARRLCRARQLRKIVAPRRLRRVLLAANPPRCRRAWNSKTIAAKRAPPICARSRRRSIFSRISKSSAAPSPTRAWRAPPSSFSIRKRGRLFITTTIPISTRCAKTSRACSDTRAASRADQRSLRKTICATP